MPRSASADAPQSSADRSHVDRSGDEPVDHVSRDHSHQRHGGDDDAVAPADEDTQSGGGSGRRRIEGVEQPGMVQPEVGATKTRLSGQVVQPRASLGFGTVS